MWLILTEQVWLPRCNLGVSNWSLSEGPLWFLAAFQHLSWEHEILIGCYDKGVLAPCFQDLNCWLKGKHTSLQALQPSRIGFWDHYYSYNSQMSVSDHGGNGVKMPRLWCDGPNLSPFASWPLMLRNWTPVDYFRDPIGWAWASSAAMLASRAHERVARSHCAVIWCVSC